jgi:hypothetical protein
LVVASGGRLLFELLAVEVNANMQLLPNACVESSVELGNVLLLEPLTNHTETSSRTS